MMLYIPLYFWAEGRWSVDEGRWYKFRISNPDQRVECTGRRAALGMLLYVIAPRVVNPAHSYYLNHQLPPCIFPRCSSSLRITMVAIQ